MKMTLPQKTKPWFAYGMVLFVLWMAVLLVALSLEHTAMGKFVFDSVVGMAVYLSVQVSLLVAALFTCSIAFILGPRRRRYFLILPICVLASYGMMLLLGPG